MATAITTQSTGPKKLGTIQLVDPANYASGKKIDLECQAYPVPEGELRPGVEANLAVDIEAYARGFYGSIHDYELRVEIEANSPNSYCPEYRVSAFDPGMKASRRKYIEYMFIYNHDDRAIFDCDRWPSTPVVEQMIGAALYYFFIDSKQDDSSSVEIPTLQQWLEEWHEIIQDNVRT